MKLLKENIGENIHALDLGKLFLHAAPKHDPQNKKLINDSSSK